MITAGYFDMNAAPMRIGTVRLKVRDLDAVSAFYQEVLGLARIETTDTRVVLGAGSLRSSSARAIRRSRPIRGAKLAFSTPPS